MTRDELRHLIRAVCAHTGPPEVIVLGSQAVLGTAAEGSLPSTATRSIEADLAVDAERSAMREGAALGVEAEAVANEIDGVFGEYSRFHATFGYYAQGVEVATAILPAGWRERLRPLTTEASDGTPVVGWCLELHDLWIAKAAAARQKDVEFCAALTAAGWVDRATLVERTQSLHERAARRVRSMVARTFVEDGRS